jgi:hypothetical protein
MGIRSFLIKFDSIESVKKFFLWRKYLAYLVSEHYDDEWYITNYEPILNKGLPENVNDYARRDFGDFDLHLEGLKFWAGGIWGLISTYTVGESTFGLLQKILDGYYSRLWAIDTNSTDYNQTPQIMIPDYYSNPSSRKAIELFNELNEQHKDKMLNYNLIISTNGIELDSDKFIAFKTRKIFELFNINCKYV